MFITDWLVNFSMWSTNGHMGDAMVDTNSTTVIESGKKLSRRSVLKFSSGAITAGAVPQVVSGKDVEMVKLPYAFGREGVREYFQVPKSWNKHRIHVEEVHSTLVDSLSGTPGYHASAIVSHPEGYGGKTGLQIRLELHQDELTREIPDRIEGVPTTVTEPRRRLPGCCDGCCGTTTCDVNRCYYDKTPGGSVIDSVQNTSEGTGTVCSWVEYNGTKYILTAAHLEDGGNCDDSQFNSGDPYQQLSRKVGGIYDYDTNADMLLIDNSDGNHDPTDKIRTESDTKTVNGVLSKSAVSSNLQDDGTCGDDERKVYAQGVTTGKTQGCITAYESTNDDSHVCWDYNRQGIEFGPLYVADGDSGGPVFVDNGSWVYLVCMFSAHLDHYSGDFCGGDYGSSGEGTAAYHLRNSYHLTFDLNLNTQPNCIDCDC